jgi:hypothetical protein
MLIRHIRRASWVLGAVCAALLFFIGGALLRLLMGPISLGPIDGAIEDSLNRSVSGVVVRFDQAVLELSRSDWKIHLTVLGTKILDLNGRIIAQAPKANLDFDVADLMAGHLSLKRFALVGVQLTGVRSKEGVIKLGFGLQQDDSDLLKMIRDILQSNDKGGGSLDTISVRDARLAFRDEPTGLFIVSPTSNFTVQNRNGHLDASLNSTVEISGVPARIAATATLRDNGMPERGTLDIRGLSLPALMKNNLVLSYLRPYQVTSDANASFEFDEHGAVLSANFQLTGEGTIEAAALKTPLNFDSFEIKGGYDGTLDNFAFETIDLRGKQMSAKAKGTVALVWKEGAVNKVSSEIEAEDVSLVFPRLFRQELALSRISLNAVYDQELKKFTFQRAVLNGEALSADLAGSATLAGNRSPALALHGTLDALSIRDILFYWPVGVGEGARDWIDTNVQEGRIGPVRLEADFAAGMLDQDALPENALLLSFPFEGASARYLGDMTPLTNAHGEAKLTGDTFHATVAAGNVGRLSVAEGDILIANLHVPDAPAKIKVHTEGEFTDVLELIDEEPLGYTKRFGINTASTGGHAAVDLDFSIPLVRDLSVDRVQIGVRGSVADLAIPIDQRRKLEHAMVNFAINAVSLTSQGTGEVSGVPVNFKWTEDFAATAASTRVDVVGKFDDAARTKLGLIEPTWLKGTMPVTIGFTGRRFRFTEATVKADMTDASAEYKLLNLEKRSGTRATGSAIVHFADKGAIAVTDLAIVGDGLQARGGFNLDDEGRLLKVSLSDLRSGANDFAIDVEPMQGGGLAIAIQGKSLDARKILGDDKKADDKKPTPPVPPADGDNALKDPLSLNAKLDKVLFKSDADFRNLSLSVSLAGNERLTGFSLDAIGPNKDKITGSFTVDKGVRNVALDADDAGSFIHTFTGFTSVKGGKFSARIFFPTEAVAKAPPADYAGTITLTDFVVTDQPFLARLFAAATLDGPLRLLKGDGIAITKLSAPFSARGKIVMIHEGRASGPAVGGTFEGVLDRKTDRIELTGTMVPAYGLNSMLGAVPILGDILASRKGEGVFGVTYSMKGPLDDPTLSTNPLSVLTPGILRRIFEFSAPKAPPQAAIEATPAQ